MSRRSGPRWSATVSAATPRWWPRWLWVAVAGDVEVDAGGGWDPLTWDHPHEVALRGPVASVRVRGVSGVGVPTPRTTVALRDGDVLDVRLPVLPLGRLRVRHRAT